MDDTAEPRLPDYFQFSRSDLALMRRAARSNWGVPDEMRTDILYGVAKILADEDADDRRKEAAMRLVVSCDLADAAHARIEIARLKLAKPEAIDARSALLDEAERMI